MESCAETEPAFFDHVYRRHVPEPLCWNPRTELFSVEDVTFSSIDVVLVIAVVWVRQYAPTMIRPIDHEAFVSTAHEPCLHPVWGDGYRYSSLHEPTEGFEPPAIRLQGGRSDQLSYAGEGGAGLDSESV